MIEKKFVILNYFLFNYCFIFSRCFLFTDIEPSTPYTLRRIADFLNNLLNLMSDETQLPEDTLFAHVRPLNAKTVKTEQELLSKQENSFEVLEEAIEDGDDVIKSLAEGSVPEMPAVLKFKKMQQKTAVRMAMIEFQKTVRLRKV